MGRHYVMLVESGMLKIGFYAIKDAVGCGKGVLYLTSPGRPIDIGLQLARPAILVAGKVRGEMFLFLLFLHFHSCASFFPVPLFHLLYYILLSLFSLSLGDDTK